MISIRILLWIVTLCVLAGASVTDLRWRRIPNKASAMVAVTGLAIALVSRPGSLWIGLMVSLAVLLVLALASHFAVIGGGDAKMIPAVALLVPPESVLTLLLAIALAGGLLSATYLGLRYWLRAARPEPPSRDGRLSRFLRHERARILSSCTVPYGIAIFGGAIAYVISELPQCSSATSCLL